MAVYNKTGTMIPDINSFKSTSLGKNAYGPNGVEDLGINAKYPVFTLGAVRCFLNSMRLIKPESDMLTVEEYYSHELHMQIVNGKIYCVYNHNLDGGDASPLDTPSLRVDMTIVDLETMTIDKKVTLAKTGDAISDGTTVASTAGCGVPGMIAVGTTTIRTIFATKDSNGVVCECYVDYDIGTDTVGTIGKCKITVGGVQYDFTSATVKAHIDSQADANDYLSFNGSFAYDATNDIYYVAFGNISHMVNAAIVSTSDLINFEFIRLDQGADGITMNYEAACGLWTSGTSALGLFVATRSADGYTKVNRYRFPLTANTIAEQWLLPSDRSKPEFFKMSGTGTPYLALNTAGRMETNIIHPSNSDMEILAQILNFDYVDIIPDGNGNIIIGGTYNHRYIRLYKVPWNLYTIRDVVAIGQKFAEVFALTS